MVVLPALIVLTAVLAAVMWQRRPAAEELFGQGLKMLQANQPEATRELIRELRGGKDSAAWGDLLDGLRLNQLGQTEDALIALSLAGDHVQTRGEAYRTAATILLDMGRYSEAIPMLQQTLQWNPEAEEERRLLAAAYYDIGAMEPALDHLQKLQRLRTDDFRPVYMMATILNDYEQFEDAVPRYEQALHLLPDRPELRDEVLLGYCECLMRLRRFRDALQQASAGSDRPELLLAQAESYFRLREYGETAALVDRVMSAQPELLQAQLLKSQLMDLNGETEAAVQLLQQVVQQRPAELEAHLRLADLLAVSGRTEAAAAARQQANEWAAVHEEFTSLHQQLVKDTSNAKLRLKLAQLALRMQRHELSQLWARAAVGLAIDDPETRAAALQICEGRE